MKKILLSLFFTFLGFGLAFSHDGEFPWSVRVNSLYVEEVIDGLDKGYGGSTEFGFTLNGGHTISQIIGFEVGYIHSDDNFSSDGVIDLSAISQPPVFISSQDELEFELIPLFLNLTVVAACEEGFFLELGAGAGIVYVETDLDSNINSSLGARQLNDNDDDWVFGGQVFGRLGYEINEQCSFSAGVRYLMANDIDFQSVAFSESTYDIVYFINESPLDSVAYDLSLNFKF